MLALRACILQARGDKSAAERDSARAAALCPASDAQAQCQAFCVRAHVALASGNRTEADELASKLLGIGTVVVPALCSPFPTLTDVAWLFRDLGREEELRETILDATPIASAWVDASRAICDGDLPRAAAIIDGIGHPAGGRLCTPSCGHGAACIRQRRGGRGAAGTRRAVLSQGPSRRVLGRGLMRLDAVSELSRAPACGNVA